MEDEAERNRVKDVIKENMPYYYAQMAMLGLDIRKIIQEYFPEFPMIDLDESDPLDLVPHIPNQFLEAVRNKFMALKSKT